MLIHLIEPHHCQDETPRDNYQQWTAHALVFEDDADVDTDEPMFGLSMKLEGLEPPLRESARQYMIADLLRALSQKVFDNIKGD